jgi:hypothetical protein
VILLRIILEGDPLFLIRRPGAIAVAFATASQLVLGLGLPSLPLAPTAWGYYSTVIQKKTYRNFTFTSREIARCVAVTPGLKCEIHKLASATRTIQLDLGLSRAAVAARLQISSAATQSVSVKCTSGNLRAGEALVAYSVGTRYTYKIERHMTSPPYDYVIATSRLLSAFDPSPAGISCRVL